MLVRQLPSQCVCLHTTDELEGLYKNGRNTMFASLLNPLNLVRSLTSISATSSSPFDTKRIPQTSTMTDSGSFVKVPTDDDEERMRKAAEDSQKRREEAKRKREMEELTKKAGEDSQKRRGGGGGGAEGGATAA